jgi:hypothetical protein
MRSMRLARAMAPVTLAQREQVSEIAVLGVGLAGAGDSVGLCRMLLPLVVVANCLPQVDNSRCRMLSL